MPRGPKGEKRPADVIGNAVKVMRIATGGGRGRLGQGPPAGQGRAQGAGGQSPAMAAGISPTLWSMTDLAEMIDASLPKPGPRGPYEKRMVV